MRDYGLPPTVWDGDPNCDHVWGDEVPEAHPGQVNQTKWKENDAVASGQTAKRGQFCQKCGAWLGCLGLEPTLDLFINHLVQIFREARRVLHPSGTLLVNMGDSYVSNPVSAGGMKEVRTDDQTGGFQRGHSRRVTSRGNGLKPKDLIGVPWRLALALQADGWWIRNDIIWVKGLDRSEQELEAQAEVEQALSLVRQMAGNSLFGISKDLDRVLKRAEKAVERLFMVGAVMPESMKDRVTASHEYLFVFAKSKKYYWDRYAIRSKSVAEDSRKPYGSDGAWVMDGRNKWDEGAGQQQRRDSSSRNARTVWRVQVESHKPFILPDGEVIAHFASFPRALAARGIRAGTSEYGVCEKCSAPFKRIIKPSAAYAKLLGQDWADYEQDAKEGRGHSVSNQRTQKRGPAATAEYHAVGWEPTCRCFGEPDRGPVPCRKCRGTGQNSTSTKRQDDHFPEEGQRENKGRGHIGNVGKNSMEILDDLCPKCEGAGYVQGWVWNDEIIKAWPIKRPVVMDMFAGTGQTLLAGMDLNCDVIGIDLSEQYCRLSNARCEVWPEHLPEKSRDKKEPESDAIQLGLDMEG